MSTVGPVSVIVAPLPLVIVIPMSFTAMVAPDALCKVIPPTPVGPAASAITKPFLSGVCRVIAGVGAGADLASNGVSAALPQKVPTQIG